MPLSPKAIRRASSGYRNASSATPTSSGFSSRPAPTAWSSRTPRGSLTTRRRMHECMAASTTTIRRCARCSRRLREWPPRCRFRFEDQGCSKASSRGLGVGFSQGRGGGSLGHITTGRSGRPAGARRALCVGIDSYPTSPLRGCVRYAQTWSDALRGLSFEVTMLLDRDATRSAARRFEHPSPFGAGRRRARVSVLRAWDASEDLNGDEADRYDEALVPIDYYTGRPAPRRRPGEVYRSLPDGAVLTLFMDCCHSGTNSRFRRRSRVGGGTRPSIPPVAHRDS